MKLLTQWLSKTRFKQPIALDPIQRLGYEATSSILAIATEAGYIEPHRIQGICDFGAGTGGPTLALRDFFKLSETQMTLLEENHPQCRRLQKLFPNSKVLAEDGLSWLAKTNHAKDLITGFMLGPDHAGIGLAAEFIAKALSCLSPHGTLIITSDTATMHQVSQSIKELPQLTCHWGLDTTLPVTVIISKAPITDKPSWALEPFPQLPAPVIKKIDIPEVKGLWSTEEYCLATDFEKAYLQATIETFELITPKHSAIPYLKALLADVSNLPLPE